MTSEGVGHIGKEANRLDERELGLVGSSDLQALQLTYAQRDRQLWEVEVLTRLQTYSVDALAGRTGISTRRMRDILRGHAYPRSSSRRRLAEILATSELPVDSAE